CARMRNYGSPFDYW
nr:immunoglobulin heavy chain junction region [Mus musculus]MBK4188924.1 immunoglobulin heavy chain junction region [Mus musculus]